MANADDYIRASDSANDFADAEIEKLEQPALEEIDYLMTNPDGRDAEFWDSLGVDEELTLDDYDAVDDDDRDLDWVLGMAGLSAAATTQFFLDSRDKTIIRPLAYREQEVGELIITRTELLKAAKRGFDIEGTATFAKLQKQFIDELGFIKQLDNRELYTLLQEAGAIQPIDKMIASNTGYVSRMTNYRPGSPQFKGAVSDLVSSNSKRGLKAQNRRAVEKLYTMRETGGDMQTLMVWVVEGGSKTCIYCQDRAGQVKSYQSWILDGLPGADVCKGADLCNCHLASVF